MEISVFFRNRLNLCLCSFFAFLLIFSASQSFASFEDDVFARLESVRVQKKEQVKELFSYLLGRAEMTRSDKVMRDFFFFMDDLNREGLLRPGLQISKELENLVEEYTRTIDKYYLRKYLDFYDVMFVARNGDIFYTIRKEKDFHSNIFSGPLSGTTLSQSLRENASTYFVDYQYYSPAEEPAAFFVEPVVRDGRKEGWIVMQYAVNKLNALLVNANELGETGEVYLVNRQNYLLTDSRYSPEGTSLKMRINNPQVKKAFEGKAGEMVVKGYRGVRVFSSYESFDLWGAKWAIVASIDEDEVLTKNFIERQESVSSALFRRLAAQNQLLRKEVVPDDRVKKVDMDEIVKGKPGDILKTRGVSTCTAISVTLPGRFAYMTHISPFDKIYGENNLTHHLKDMVNRIKYYDIHLYEMKDLRVVVVANHLESISNIIKKLVKYGIRLSQVAFVYNPEARYANVTCEVNGGETFVEWIYEGREGAASAQKASTMEDLAEAYKKVINYRY